MLTGCRSTTSKIFVYSREAFDPLLDWLMNIHSLVSAGLSWESVAPCVRWMGPFMDTLKELPKAELKTFAKVKSDDRHNIQTHIDYLHLLVRFPLNVSAFNCQTLAPICRPTDGPQLVFYWKI